MSFVGTQVTATCTFTNAGGLYDPPQVVAYVRSPTGVLTSLAVTHVSTGVYTAQFTPDSPNTWIVRFADAPNGSGSRTVVQDQAYTVAQLLF